MTSLLQSNGQSPAPNIWSINGRFLQQKITGVQRYAREVTRAIDQTIAADDQLARSIQFELVVPPDVTGIPAYKTIPVRRSSNGSGHIWEQLILPGHAKHGLISFANLGPLVCKQQILCIHDANVYLEPQSYSRSFGTAYRLALPLLGHRVCRITTVSQFSAKMLREFAVTSTRESVVACNGHEHALTWDPTRSRFHDSAFFKRPYIFTLGSQAKHKQVGLLLELLPQLDALGLDLVIAGGSSSIFAATTSSRAPNLRLLGVVSDDDLAALFRHALCFAFPSRTEGFGIPLLEAMVHGCPIIASNLASMPEVCGSAAIYPANQAADWLLHITRLAQDPSLRQHLREAGFLRYPKFSWKDAASIYIATALEIDRDTRHAA